MKNGLFTCCALLLCGIAAPLAAESVVGLNRAQRADDSDADPTLARPYLARPYLECVPYAREVSGIRIFGDAHTWWGQAEGRYQRGDKPRVGAVMAFAPHGNMQLGHVAAVSRVIDSRTVLLRHANWSPINGRRGQIENDVRAMDVSDANDWSAVRVWYAPIQALGGTPWPVRGFIYRDGRKAAGEKAEGGKGMPSAAPSGRQFASARWSAKDAGSPGKGAGKVDMIGKIIAEAR